MTAGTIHPLSSDKYYALAIVAVWKKSIDLGVPMEFLMSESMALAPWSPGPRSRTATTQAASAYQAACHAASSGVVTGDQSSRPLPGCSSIAVPQVGPSWAPDQTVPDHHANIKPEPLQSAPESPMEVPAAAATRPSAASDRRRRKLESNRRAALKLRNKKRAHIDNIFVTIAKLENKNAALQRELSLIRSLRKASPKAN